MAEIWQVLTMVYDKKLFNTKPLIWYEEYRQLSLEEKEHSLDELIDDAFLISNEAEKKAQLILLLPEVINILKQRKKESGLSVRNKWRLLKLKSFYLTLKRNIKKSINFRKEQQEIINRKGVNIGKHSQIKK